ncbi:11043_t:CDS:1, partial [Scutellospora calospora]
LYEMILMLNTITEPNDEYLIYDDENISTSILSYILSILTLSQVS